MSSCYTQPYQEEDVISPFSIQVYESMEVTLPSGAQINLNQNVRSTLLAHPNCKIKKIK